VNGEVELTAGSMGRCTARQSVSVRTDDIGRFRDELAVLLEHLSGEATLEHLEQELRQAARR